MNKTCLDIQGITVGIHIVSACSNKIDIFLTHDDVEVAIRNKDSETCKATDFGPASYINSGSPLFYYDWVFSDFLSPDETFDHFNHYNGTGDWKFYFFNDGPADI